MAQLRVRERMVHIWGVGGWRFDEEGGVGALRARNNEPADLLAARAEDDDLVGQVRLDEGVEDIQLEVERADDVGLQSHSHSTVSA